MANNRFGRNYILIITGSDGSPVIIQPPLTIEFQVSRDYLSSSNVSQIRIYGLGEHKRNLIQKDPINTIGDVRPMELRAGYGKNLVKIFSGNYTQAFSVREGNVYVTTITAFDGGAAYANATSNQPFGPGMPKLGIIRALINDLGKFGIEPGVIGQVENTNTLRSTTYTGPTMKLIQELTKGRAFIDLGRCHVLQDTDVLSATAVLVNAETGLKGTPVFEQYKVSFEMIFEPAIIVGQAIQLQSSTITRFNGQYKVYAVRHSGTISDAVGGQCSTQVTVQFGDLFNKVGV